MTVVQVMIAGLSFVVAALYLGLAVIVVPWLARQVNSQQQVVRYALWGAVAFFLGCGATHISIAVHALGADNAHPATTPAVVVGHVIPHLAQFVGGVAFTLLVKLRLNINIESKTETERIPELEQRLDEALAAGESGAWSLDTETGEVWRSEHHDRIFGYTAPPGTWKPS